MQRTDSSSSGTLSRISPPSHDHLCVWHPKTAALTTKIRGPGFHIGGRSTIVKLPSSDLFVYVSTPHSEATQAVIRRLGGNVKYLVTPDGEHDMHIEQWAKAYPDAKCAIGNRDRRILRAERMISCPRCEHRADDHTVTRTGKI